VAEKRPRYPSDHRDDFRVFEDLLDNEKVAAIDLADFGLYVKLLAVLRRQESLSGVGRLDHRAATALARCVRWPYARPYYQRLAAAKLIWLKFEIGSIEYLVPNWPKYQQTTPALKRSEEAGQLVLTAPPVNGRRTRKKAPGVEVAFPEPFPDELRARLMRWAPTKGFSEAQVDYAIDAVREKSAARGYLNVEWDRAIQGYMREGWALRGFAGTAGAGTAFGSVQQAVEASRRRDGIEGERGERAEATGNLFPVHDVPEDPTRS